jgi:tetratricopeptide (TPR) repeat protein
MTEIDAAKEQYDEAGVEAQRAIALDPNSAPAYAALASVMNSENRPVEALVAGEKAIRLDPRNADKYMADQGFADLSLGRYKEAILALKDFLARYPDAIWAHAWLARADSQLGDDGGARAEAAEVERAVALTPNSAAGYDALAFTLNWLGKPAEALVAVDKAIRLDPKNSVNYVYERGRAYTLLGRWQEAIPIIKPVLARNPYNFWAHAFLAVDYVEIGHDDDARAEVAEVRRLNPEFSVETMFPPAGMQSKVLKTDRFRDDLRKAGLT